MLTKIALYGVAGFVSYEYATEIQEFAMQYIDVGFGLRWLD